MGCWYETCGFSNLPINEEDEVLWTIIKRVDRSDKDEGLRLEDIERGERGDPDGEERWTGRRGDDIMRPFDIWQPVVPFSEGAYDDYGGVEMDEAAWTAAQERLKRHGVELRRNPWGGNFRANDRMFVLPPNMQFWMMRRDCFEILAGLPHHDYWCDTKTLGAREQKKFEEVREFLQEQLATDPMKFSIRSINETFGRIEAPSFHFYHMGVSGATEIARRDGLDAAMEYLRPFMEVQRVFYGMDVLRKSLAPTVGKGSQDWSADAHRYMAQYIERVCQEYMEDFD